MPTRQKTHPSRPWRDHDAIAAKTPPVANHGAPATVSEYLTASRLSFAYLLARKARPRMTKLKEILGSMGLQQS
jgi:hypothetical protein